MKVLNIITPCSRPQNLLMLSESINIPKDNYRWIVVYDGIELPNKDLIPENCEIYSFKDESSTYGNYQRNYGLNLIEEGHIYFNDDDTTLHPQLWENVKNLENDFITFNQVEKNGTPRLIDRKVELTGVDSHNFIFHHSLIEGVRFKNTYDADGYFAIDCFKKAKNYIHLSKVLSVYNSLALMPHERMQNEIQNAFRFFIR
jgi:hypothetical protein